MREKLLNTTAKQTRILTDEIYLTQLEMRHPETLAALKAGKFDDTITGVLETVAKEISSKY